uniref:Uncharacterized protein n=1 Tax=Anopheles quadriannulatus TaxID=34691 RepID=A0A182XQ97_ANOQN
MTAVTGSRALSRETPKPRAAALSEKRHCRRPAELPPG